MVSLSFVLLSHCDGFGEPGKESKAFSNNVAKILAISITEVAVHKGFFWKVLICELLKDEVDITSWSRDSGFYIPNCDSLPCHAMHFLAL